MNRPLNGASAHTDGPGAYSATSGAALDAWLSSAREQRDLLLRELEQVTRQAAGLRPFANLRESTLRLADRLHERAALELDRVDQEIAEYDAKSETLLAESSGAVKKNRALLFHLTAPGPSPGLPNSADDIEQVREALRTAESEDAWMLRARLGGRHELNERWIQCATRVVESSARVLALAEPERLAFEAAASRAEDLKRQVRQLERDISATEQSAKA